MGISVPADFLQAMANLQKSGGSNVLYRLAKGLSTMRRDGRGSKFPTNRMPMGLLEYMVGFLTPRLHHRYRLSSIMSNALV